MKIKLKHLILFFMCVTTLFGCSSSNYERDTSPGEIKTISLKELSEKMENKDTFTVMLTQSMCGYCQEFKTILTDYQKEHNLVMNEVVLDKENATPQENLKIIKPYFSDFSTTPGIFYVEKGESKSHLKEKGGTINTEHLDEWVQEFKLDRKK